MFALDMVYENFWYQTSSQVLCSYLQKYAPKRTALVITQKGSGLKFHSHDLHVLALYS